MLITNLEQSEPCINCILSTDLGHDPSSEDRDKEPDNKNQGQGNKKRMNGQHNKKEGKGIQSSVDKTSSEQFEVKHGCKILRRRHMELLFRLTKLEQSKPCIYGTLNKGLGSNIARQEGEPDNNYQVTSISRCWHIHFS